MFSIPLKVQLFDFNNWTSNGIEFDADTSNSACAIDDAPVYAGTRSWKFNGNVALDDWYINFSGGLTTKSLSFWWMMEYNAAAFYMYFYNSDDEIIATIQWNYGSYLLVNKDHENSSGYYCNYGCV